MPKGSNLRNLKIVYISLADPVAIVNVATQGGVKSSLEKISYSLEQEGGYIEHRSSLPKS